MLNLPWYLWLSFKMGLNRSYNLLLGERVLPISITWNPSTFTTRFPNKINTFVKTRNRTTQYTNMNSQCLLTHLLLMIWSTSRFFLTCKTRWFDLQLTFIHITIIWIYIYIYSQSDNQRGFSSKSDTGQTLWFNYKTRVKISNVKQMHVINCNFPAGKRHKIFWLRARYSDLLPDCLSEGGAFCFSCLASAS
jgi:hypothetical protein